MLNFSKYFRGMPLT